MIEPNQKVISILLVDDNDNDVLMIRDVFRKFTVIDIADVVSDGDEALMYLFRQGPYQNKPTPDMILLDINMPKKNGFEVLDIIKTHEALRSIPVVMLTTSDHEADIVKSYAKGACSYISKPVNPKEFFDMVAQFSVYWSLIAKLPEAVTFTP